MVLNIFILTIAVFALIYPEIGLGVVFITPLVKDVLSTNATFGIDLTLFFSIITYLSFIIKYKRYLYITYLSKRQIVMQLIFLAILILSYTYTVAPKYGAEKLVRYTFFNFLLYFVSLLMFTNIINIKIPFIFNNK